MILFVGFGCFGEAVRNEGFRALVEPGGWGAGGGLLFGVV